METLKHFSQLPGGYESEPEEVPQPKIEKERGEEYIEMLDKMELLKSSDAEKISEKAFFDLAISRCGFMSPPRRYTSPRRVISYLTYQKAFNKYYGFAGVTKKKRTARTNAQNDYFVDTLDKMIRNGEISVIPHDKGKDSYLCSPIIEE